MKEILLEAFCAGIDCESGGAPSFDQWYRKSNAYKKLKAKNKLLAEMAEWIDKAIAYDYDPSGDDLLTKYNKQK